MLTAVKNYFFKFIKNPIIIITFVFITAITLFLYVNNKDNQQQSDTKIIQQHVEKIQETPEIKQKKKTLLEEINALNEKIAIEKNQEVLDKLAAEKENLVKEYQKLEEQAA